MFIYFRFPNIKKALGLRKWSYCCLSLGGKLTRSYFKYLDKYEDVKLNYQ